MHPAPGVAGDLLSVGGSVLDLLGRVEVVQRWDQPSALPQMSVGALAAHLGSQVLSVHAAVTAGEAVSSAAPVTLLEHYDRVAWVRDGLDDPSNVTIREGAQRSASPGHGALVSSFEGALADLRLAFGTTLPEGLPPGIRMPWWEWTLSFEDFLTTRVMEMVVHADDLAVSIDAAPPQLPEPVLGPVLALLVGVSLRRHGQAALIRSLARSERAPRSISAF